METMNCVELLLFRVVSDQLQILLIPSNHCWSLPSLPIQKNSMDETVVSIINENITTSQKIYYRQMYTLTRIAQDQSQRVITTSYLSLVCNDDLQVMSKGQWFQISKQTYQLNQNNRKSRLILSSQDELMEYEIIDEVTMNYIAKESSLQSNSNSELGNDHIKTVNMAMDRLQHGIASSGLLFNLLADSFTLKQAQTAYEAVMNKKVDTPNFRRDIVKMLTPTGVNIKSGRKEAMTYRFNPLFQYLREDL